MGLPIEVSRAESISHASQCLPSVGNEKTLPGPLGLSNSSASNLLKLSCFPPFCRICVKYERAHENGITAAEAAPLLLVSLVFRNTMLRIYSFWHVSYVFVWRLS